MASQEKEHPAQTLLSKAHPQQTSTQIFKEKIQNRPLLLRPSTPDPLVGGEKNKRTQRQTSRLQKAALSRKSKKPRSLTAKRKRELGVYDIPADERKFEIYEPVNGLWCAYMREILGLERVGCVSVVGAGPMLTSADFHGALVEVVRCRCVGRVGIKGIVVKDTKFTFEIVTMKNEIKTVPKEHTIFRFEVPFPVEEGKEARKPLVFELHGSQFENRAPDRANRKFKQHIDPDL